MVQVKTILTIGFILIIFASQAMWVTFSPVLTEAADELGVSVELLGLLAIMYPALFLILTIPSGILLDKSFKKWFLFGCTATFIGAAGRLLSLNYIWLVICQLFGAVGQPFLLNAFVPYASQLYEKRRTTIISILSLSMYLGVVFSLAAGVELYSIGGLYTLLMPTALISVVGIAMIALSSGNVEMGETGEYSLRRFGDVIKRRDLWILGFILGFGIATFDNLATWLQPALRDVGLEGVAGDAVAASIILGLVGVAVIPDRVCPRNLRTIYIRVITPIIAAFFLTLVFMVNTQLLFIFLGVSGLLMLPAYAIIMDWIGKFHEKEVHGSATGFIGLTSRAISVALTLGAVYFIGSATTYFAYLTTPITVAFIMTLILPNDHKKG